MHHQNIITSEWRVWQHLDSSSWRVTRYNSIAFGCDTYSGWFGDMVPDGLVTWLCQLYRITARPEFSRFTQFEVLIKTIRLISSAVRHLRRIIAHLLLNRHVRHHQVPVPVLML